MENAADDQDMGEVDDEMYFHGRLMGESDTDYDDEYAFLVIPDDLPKCFDTVLCVIRGIPANISELD